MNYGKLAKSVLVPVVGGSLVGIFATRDSKEIYDKLKVFIVNIVMFAKESPAPVDLK
ncbi:hypothetical protein ACIQYG_05950 [Peribacillus sp. NPDC096622]|uniref:hypothetical protein n=1 Tax=Peribacillus sp. NPDC096622 TaxID=3364396 RepID=UPI003802F5CF